MALFGHVICHGRQISMSSSSLTTRMNSGRLSALNRQARVRNIDPALSIKGLEQ